VILKTLGLDVAADIIEHIFQKYETNNLAERDSPAITFWQMVTEGRASTIHPNGIWKPNMLGVGNETDTFRSPSGV
jgi:hypothetical protein